MDIPQIIAKQRAFFRTQQTKDVSFRRAALKQFAQALKDFEPAIMDALKEDLNKAPSEAYMCEVGLSLADLNEAISHLRKWSKPRRVHTPLSQFPASSYVHPEPLGVVLVISPWNYPVLLSLAPLIAAIAAGNCCILKPSEMAPATSRVLRELLESCFPSEHVCVLEGGVETSTALLEQPFDHIFYTGGGHVAKVVMSSAAKHLCPVTLELGGKSPCIVDETANIKLSATRIAFGKILNAAQTCVAPDYLMIHRSVKDAFIQAFQQAVKEMLGDNPLLNPNYTRIINERHFQRLRALMANQTIICGGAVDEEKLLIEPTLLEAATVAPIMQEEIFGPLMPVMVFDDLSEVESYILDHDKPLACYLFTSSKANEKRVLKNISYGGGCVNDTIVHLAVTSLPFGGVGGSGMGRYHGKYGFDTFSHQKAIMRKARWIDLPFRYQPYSSWKDKILRLFLR